MAVAAFVVLARSYCFKKSVHAVMAATRPNWLETGQIAVVRPIKALAIAVGSRSAAATCSIVGPETSWSQYSYSWSHTASVVQTGRGAIGSEAVYSAADHYPKR